MFQNGSPMEAMATLTNSIDNFSNPEIAKAAEDGSGPSCLWASTPSVHVRNRDGTFGATRGRWQIADISSQVDAYHGSSFDLFQTEPPKTCNAN